MTEIDTYFADYQGKKCLLLGSTGVIGEKLVDYCKKMDIQLVTLNPDTEGSPAAVSNDETNPLAVNIPFVSGDETSIRAGLLKAEQVLGSIDYLLCHFDLEGLRKTETLTCENWDRVLCDWGLNYFLLIKLVVTHFKEDKKRHIVYFNSLHGYTGEGEGEGSLVPGGTLIEAACSSGITGMMTAIARSIIPRGYSVNGIALGENPNEKWPKIQWALNLWLSGIGEYSCGEIYRVY